MNSLGDRITEIIDTLGITKTAFAKRLNVSQPLVSMYCNGTSRPSDRTISDICEKFNVNEVWLRTGEGEPYRKETRQEQIMRFATQTVKGSDEFRKSFVAMLAKMDADDWEALSRLFQKLSSELNTQNE